MSWDSKAVPNPCPRCGRHLRLEVVLVAGDIGSFSLAGVQTKFSARVTPKLYCDGDPMGFPPERSCGWFMYGAVEGGEAVFRGSMPE